MSELYKCPICRADMRLVPRFGGGHVYMCHNDACEVVGQEIGTTMLEALNRRAPSAEQHAQLMKFYNVTSVDALVEAQSKHIEKLQAKLPASPSLAPNIVREG